MLRLPREMSKEEKDERVDAIIAELGLIKSQDTKVGNELIRGVSTLSLTNENLAIPTAPGLSKLEAAMN